MYLGNMDNPITIDKQKNIYKNLDKEFENIVELWSWVDTGLLQLTVNQLPYYIAVGLRYLIKVNNGK